MADQITLDDFSVDASGNITCSGGLTASGALSGTTGTFTGSVGVTGDVTASGGVRQGTTAWEMWTYDALLDQTNQGGATTVYTVPAGKTLIMEYAVVVILSSFDGTTPTLILGDASDADGYIPSVDLTGSGATGLGADERGAYLWDGAGTHQILHTAAAADVVNFTLGGSGATTGSVRIILMGRLLPTPS